MVWPPACPMMADWHGMIAAAAVDHIQIRELRHCQIATSQSIDDDLATWVNCPDGRNCTPYQSSMVVARHAVRSGRRRLVDQIKAEKAGRHALISTSERFPQKHERPLR